MQIHKNNNPRQRAREECFFGFVQDIRASIFQVPPGQTILHSEERQGGRSSNAVRL